MNNTIQVVSLSNNKSIGKYKHLTYADRVCIALMLKQNKKQAEIAVVVGCSPSTISREISRYSTKVEVEIKTTKKYLPLTEVKVVYDPDIAHMEYLKSRKACNGTYKLYNSSGYIKFIEDTILFNPKLYSPDVANELARKAGYQCVSTKTLYTWIENNLLKVKNIHLLRKVGRRIRRSKPHIEQKRHYGTSIDLRPDAANSREEFGHWEGDSIILAEHKGQIITIQERQQRLGFAFKFDNIKAENILTVLKFLKDKYDVDFKWIFKSITFDNGTEFAYFDKMQEYTTIYYAHAYCSWERGSNENFNGIIRRFIPKGTHSSKVTQAMLDEICDNINNTPRKILDYSTPMENFLKVLNTQH